MKEKFRRAVSCAKWIIMCFFILSLWQQEAAALDSITFRIIAINPSQDKIQTVEVKKYLLKEVTPKDIVDLGGLQLEYDSDKALYYVYKNKVELSPAEVRTFSVTINDIWMIEQDSLSDLEGRTQMILSSLKDREYYDKAEALANSIYGRLGEVKTSQLDDTISREQHIGVYRQNLGVLREVKEDIAKMEKILVTAGGPPAPEMLQDTKIKADSPSHTMTWIVIFSIIVFTGLLAGVLFFTWYRQSHVAKDKLSQAKKSAFPEFGPDKGEEGKKGEK